MFYYTLLCMIDTLIQHFSPNIISAILLLFLALLWSFLTCDYIIATPVVIFIWTILEEKFIINIIVFIITTLEFIFVGWYYFYRKSEDCTDEHVNECKKFMYYSTVIIFVPFSRLNWVIGLAGLIICGMVIFYMIYTIYKENSKNYLSVTNMQDSEQNLYPINDDDI